MAKMTDSEKAMVQKFNHKLYTVEFLSEWLERKDTVFENAPAALQAIAAEGFYQAIKQAVIAFSDGQEITFPASEMVRVDDIQCPWCGVCFDGSHATNFDTDCSFVKCSSCGGGIEVLQSVQYTCRKEEG